MTIAVKIGNLIIGDNNPIRVQTMTTTDTRNLNATVNQILELEKIGCEMIRVAVPDMDAAKNLSKIKKYIHIPLIADVHFDWKLAIESVKNNADKIRINPGNIEKKYLKEIVKICKEKNIPIRVGTNAGSLKALKKYNSWPDWTPDEWVNNMVSEAMEYIKILEDLDFFNIVVSLKASDVQKVVGANRKISKMVRYPIHLGLTEAGSLIPGLIKTTIAFYILLNEKIGDTIRVSISEDPKIQIRAGFEILKILSLRQYGPEIISCPTCGRCEVDLFKILKELEKKIFSDAEFFTKVNKKIAVMGCVVNGPGESKQADIGIAGGKGKGVLIKKGEVLETLPENKWIDRLIESLK